MKRKKVIRVVAAAFLLMAVMLAFSMTAFADGDVSGAIQNTWDAAKTQIKTVVDNVVFTALDLILAVLFFVKVGSSYFEYRKHGMFEFTAPALLFATLLFVLTCPLYIWPIIGM